MAKKAICEDECPACGEVVKFYELGWTICSFCKTMRAELTITNWEEIEEEE